MPVAPRRNPRAGKVAGQLEGGTGRIRAGQAWGSLCVGGVDLSRTSTRQIRSPFSCPRGSPALFLNVWQRSSWHRSEETLLRRPAGCGWK